MNISDDILIYGRIQDEHDDSLKATFKRLCEKNLTLNTSKCSFNKSSLEYFGYVFSDKGVSPDPKKVEAIKNAKAPASPAEVRSLLGMANYCGRFIPDLATITQPLRDLTKQDTEWNWTTKHQKALDTLKERLTCDTIMAYYDPTSETKLVVDASPVGLGAILVQHVKGREEMPRIVSYASRSLTPVEARYSQIEREGLAVVWACEKYHLYVYGKPFTVVTDHKPLEPLYNDPRSKPPARIEQWALKLQPYNFTVMYRAGKDNPADYMSRHTSITTQQSSREAKVAEEYINFVTTNAVPKALSVDEIKSATKGDSSLQAKIATVRSGQWHKAGPKVHKPTFKALYNLRHDLTVTSDNDIIRRGPRIVIPSSLQNRTIEIAQKVTRG